MTTIDTPAATEQRRGPGRPPKNRPATAAPVAPAAITEAPSLLVSNVAPNVTMYGGYPCMSDDEMEQYGGDLAASEAWSRKSRRPLATWRDSPNMASVMPDLLTPGMLVHRAAPEQRFHFAYLTEDGSQAYGVTRVAMSRRGYKPVTVAEWYVHSVLRDILIPEDGTGRLTLGGAIKGGATVVYSQDEANYNRFRAYERRLSDEIQKTAEQKRSEMQEQLNREGFGDVRTSLEFEDE